MIQRKGRFIFSINHKKMVPSHFQMLFWIWIVILQLISQSSPTDSAVALTISSKYPPALPYVTSLHRAPQTYDRGKDPSLPHPFVLVSKVRPCYSIESARRFGLLKHASPSSMGFVTQFGGNIRLDATLKPPDSDRDSSGASITTSSYRRWQSPTASTEPPETSSRPSRLPAMTTTPPTLPYNTASGFSGKFTVTQPTSENNRAIIYNTDGTRVVPETLYKFHTKEPQLWEPVVVYLNATIKDVATTTSDTSTKPSRDQHTSASSWHPTTYETNDRPAFQHHPYETSNEENPFTSTSSNDHFLFPTHGSDQNHPRPITSTYAGIVDTTHYYDQQPEPMASQHYLSPFLLPPPPPPVNDRRKYFLSGITDSDKTSAGPPHADSPQTLQTQDAENDDADGGTVGSSNRPAATVATAQRVPTTVVSVTYSGLPTIASSAATTSSEQQHSGESLLTKLGGGAKNIINQLFGGILSGGGRHTAGNGENEQPDKVKWGHPEYPMDLNSWSDKLKLNVSGGSSSISYLRPDNALPRPTASDDQAHQTFPQAAQQDGRPESLFIHQQQKQKWQHPAMGAHGRPPYTSLVDVFAGLSTATPPATTPPTLDNIYFDLRKTMPFGLASYTSLAINRLLQATSTKSPSESTMMAPASKENREDSIRQPSQMHIHDEMPHVTSLPPGDDAQEKSDQDGSDYGDDSQRLSNFLPPLGIHYDSHARLPDGLHDPMSDNPLTDNHNHNDRLKITDENVNGGIINGEKANDGTIHSRVNGQSFAEVTDDPELTPKMDEDIPETSTTSWRPLQRPPPFRVQQFRPTTLSTLVQPSDDANHRIRNSSNDETIMGNMQKWDFESTEFTSERPPNPTYTGTQDDRGKIDFSTFRKNTTLPLTMATPIQIARLPSRMPITFEVTTYRPRKPPSPMDWLFGFPEREDYRGGGQTSGQPIPFKVHPIDVDFITPAPTTPPTIEEPTTYENRGHPGMARTSEDNRDNAPPTLPTREEPMIYENRAHPGMARTSDDNRNNGSPVQSEKVSFHTESDSAQKNENLDLTIENHEQTSRRSDDSFPPIEVVPISQLMPPISVELPEADLINPTEIIDSKVPWFNVATKSVNTSQAPPLISVNTTSRTSLMSEQIKGSEKDQNNITSMVNRTTKEIYDQIKEVYQKIRLGIPMPFDVVKPFFDSSNILAKSSRLI